MAQWRVLRNILVCVAVGLMARVAGAEVRLSYQDLLAHLTDLDRLPVIEDGVCCRQSSSYDRNSTYDASRDMYMHWAANHDDSNYLSVDPVTQEGVMADMQGPGCIFRIWSADPSGVIRFYLDGDTQPTYEWEFHRLFTGAIEPFMKPLVWKRDPHNSRSGSDCYLPIPFAKSCRVTGVILKKDGKAETPRQFYHIDYRLFPRDWKLETFKLPLSDEQRQAVQQTARAWSQCGQMATDPRDRRESRKVELPAGETTVMAELKGPAVIRQCLAKLRGKEKWATRKVLLKIYWDGERTPAVNCPIGDFFGEPREANYKSYPMGITDEANYCFFPMPFHKSAKVVMVNEGREPAPVEMTLAYRDQEVPPNWGLFHAKWRVELSSTSVDYPLINTQGTGKLVGICLFPDNLHGGWWGEGDEKVYVDGEKFPSWFGTGSEDYFGDAWGIRHLENPSHGCPMKTEERMQGCYRWHLGDNIPFSKSLVMTIENYSGMPQEPVHNDYSSVAYWYQLPGGSDFFTDTPVTDRIPRNYVAPGAIEAERCIPPDGSLKTGMTIVSEEGLPQPLSSGRGVKLVDKVGDAFTFDVPAAIEDVHIVAAVPMRGLPSSSYAVEATGQKAKDRFSLKKGLNPITIRFTGKPAEGDRCELIVDYFQVEVQRHLIREWMVIGPFPNQEDEGYDAVYSPEKEIAIRAKYKGRDGKEVGWQRVENGIGMIVLNSLFAPKEHLVAYGACVVNAPRAGRRTLLVGSDDAVKVWLNGKLVWQHFVQRAVVPDSDQVDVELAQGKNVLLIKVEQGFGDVGWAVRFIDPEAELTYGLPE